jgi:hypothetical protein
LASVVKGHLNFNEPSISVGMDLFYEEGEGLEEDEIERNQSFLPKAIKDLPAGGIVHGAQLEIEDFSQALKVPHCDGYSRVFRIERAHEGD